MVLIFVKNVMRGRRIRKGVIEMKKVIWMCSCGVYWEHSKEDAEAHLRYFLKYLK